VPEWFNKGIAKNMSTNSGIRGSTRTPEEARAIWIPLIAEKKVCFQCVVAVIELGEHVPRQASPQRIDPTILTYANGNCVVFCLFCQMFNLDALDGPSSTAFV
jgi:hypothetical protein